MSEDKLTGEPIPERRPEDSGERPQHKAKTPSRSSTSVWRCQVCGYLCAREKPPDKCPICKAEKDRFEVFEFG